MFPFVASTVHDSCLHIFFRVSFNFFFNIFLPSYVLLLSSRFPLFSLFPLTFSLFFLLPLSLLLQYFCLSVSFTVVFKVTILVSVVFHLSFPLYTILIFLRLIRTFLYPCSIHPLSIALLFFTSEFIHPYHLRSFTPVQFLHLLFAIFSSHSSPVFLNFCIELTSFISALFLIPLYFFSCFTFNLLPFLSFLTFSGFSFSLSLHFDVTCSFTS